ncbi:PADR1 domain protein [Onchocerca flexuosa]|uniref:NAD(+) ADP-ribosyltransferase n=1 Tax=Onchocerca flexuosa TaxID=387005 RepID=A0A238BTD3_9BILA|nr:PADR1 domain protein [Onchocerca flexuosa]
MASMGRDLSYGAEYAKSNRAACKGCHGLISQNSLRMSFRKPSRFFDGLQDNWYNLKFDTKLFFFVVEFHFACFWKKIKQDHINEASIRGMELLKWSDQERIRKKIIENQAGVSCVEDLSVVLISEYAATGRSKCVNCKKNIKKENNTLRLGMKSSWYHVNCFEKMRQYAICTEKIVGFQNLSESDQDLLKLMFNKQIKTTTKKKSAEINDAATKRAKMDQFDTEEKMKLLKAQANEMWSVREKLSKCLSKNDIQTLLQANHQALPKRGGESKLLDRLVDCMVFGCPLPCEHCKEGNIVYSSSERSYVCTGYISEYTRCMYTCRNPPRKPFVIPDEMKKIISEFQNFEVRDPKNREYSALEHEKPEPSKILSRDVGEMSNEFMKHGNANLRGKLWETTLGKADFQTGANSFYKLQLLKHDFKQKPRRLYLQENSGKDVAY